MLKLPNRVPMGSKNTVFSSVLTDAAQSNQSFVNSAKSERQGTCKPALRFDKTVKRRIRLVNRNQSEGVYQSHPKLAVAWPLPVSQLERQRILARHHSGQSLRRISREEGRARQTVTRIARSIDTQAEIEEMRRRYWGLAPDALNSVRRAIQNDPWFAITFLRHIGVIPKRNQGHQVAMC